MPPKLKDDLLRVIETRLSDYLGGRTHPPEVATTFNYILYDEFNKERTNGSGKGHSLKPVFVGEYFVDPVNPEQTRVFSHQGTEACSPIPITRGVIGRAVTTGRNQYVPDVTQDPEHVGCDPDMEGSELVLVAWSEPFAPGNPHGIGYVGRRVPLGVLDLDFNVKYALNRQERGRLKKIWEEYAKRIFPGEAQFQPRGKLCVK